MSSSNIMSTSMPSHSFSTLMDSWNEEGFFTVHANFYDGVVEWVNIHFGLLFVAVDFDPWSRWHLCGSKRCKTAEHERHDNHAPTACR